jgi:4-hydroxy-3-methylbut-2-enyl diphosphate reductase
VNAVKKNNGIIKGSLLVAKREGRAGSSVEDRQAYGSPLVDALRANGYTLTTGRITIFCAEAFGFCWGVDKAVDIVQEALDTYPGKRIWILNQIIHNPAVNRDFIERGARFIKGSYASGNGFEDVGPDDVAIIPAFSAEVGDIERLRSIGCTVIDTTCPWVLKPHLRTKRNIEAGFTTVIHATLGHDETNATCTLIEHEGGKYVVVRNVDEARVLCRGIEGKAEASEVMEVLGKGTSPGFDPKRDLDRIALINQTTMLASESREIGRMIEGAVRRRDGDTAVPRAFRDFDTICNATQENQDAMVAMVETKSPDLVMVVGGYNSSNTKNLARIAHVQGVPTYHIEDATSLEPTRIRHQPIERYEVVETLDWLPAAGSVRVGFTAGASTPDTRLAAVIERLVELAGERLELPGDRS